jgi:hypothetical protein
VTVDVQGGTSQPPAQSFSIKQDVKYDGGLALTDPKKFDVKLQKWKMTPFILPNADQNLYIITSDHFPGRILQPLNLDQDGTPLVLVPKPKTLTAANVWMVTGPVVNA